MLHNVLVGKKKTLVRFDTDKSRNTLFCFKPLCLMSKLYSDQYSRYNIFAEKNNAIYLPRISKFMLKYSDGVLEYCTPTRRLMYSVKKSAEYTSTFGFR